MSSIIYCKECLFPNTKPDLFFDSEGVCDACITARRKHGIENSIDWNTRAQEFQEIVSEVQSSEPPFYDCVVPVSGGKDSTWQAYAAKMIHGLHPLAVTFDQFDQTDIGRHNLEILRGVGVDHIHFTLNPNVVKSLVRKGFEIIGDPYWVNHVGMFSVPFTVAKQFRIPLIIYGENPQFEYGGPAGSRDARFMDRRWRQEFGGMRGMREDDTIDERDNISEKDLCLLQFPNLDEDTLNIKAVFYGYYYKWDISEHLKVVRSLGWKPLSTPPAGSWLDYENCDMKFIDIRERIKYLKYGYGRASDQLNIEIRAGRISRDRALEIVNQTDGNVAESNISDFCNFLNMSRDTFDRTMDSFVNEDIFVREDDLTWTLRSPRY